MTASLVRFSFRGVIGVRRWRRNVPVALRSWIIGDSAEASCCIYPPTDETVRGDLESRRRARAPCEWRYSGIKLHCRVNYLTEALFLHVASNEAAPTDERTSGLCCGQSSPRSASSWDVFVLWDLSCSRCLKHVCPDLQFPRSNETRVSVPEPTEPRREDVNDRRSSLCTAGQFVMIKIYSLITSRSVCEGLSWIITTGIINTAADPSCPHSSTGGN